MKKTHKIIAVLLASFIMLGVGGIIVTQRATEVSASAESVAAAVIKQGSRGESVRQIQTKLKRWGYYSGAVDGIFGSQTQKAVRYFQSKNGLVVDGIVGPATLKALGMSANTTGSQASSPSYSNSDVYLLARVIYGEARGESYTGQIAVGAVVMNRIKSSSFPNTISAVVYQPYAFTAVADGQINLTPDDRAIKAAKEAMNGYDPTYGALYYYNPATATSSWIFSRKTTVVIGRHVFAV